MPDRFFMLTLSLSLLSGCFCFTRDIEVTPDDLPALARYDKDNPITVVDKGEQLYVEPRFDPELYFSLKRGRTIYARLENLRLEDGEVHLTKAHLKHQLQRYTDIKLSLEGIHSIGLSLSGYVPPDWDPEWGLVLSLLGPSGYLGVGVQWYALKWLALDVGTSWVLGAGAGHGITGFFGFRVLPTHSRFKPFMGGGITGFAFPNHGGAGVVLWRAGFDVEISNNRMLFRYEINVVYFLNKSGFPNDHFEERGGWPCGPYILPWMGIAMVYML